jgi:uncharacterized membrane protein
MLLTKLLERCIPHDFYFMRDGIANRLLFLAGGLLGGHGRAFFGGCRLGFGLFLAGFLLVRFRGSISHVYTFH